MKLPKRLFRPGFIHMTPVSASHPWHRKYPTRRFGPKRPMTGSVKRAAVSAYLNSTAGCRFHLPKQFKHWMQRLRIPRDSSIKGRQIRHILWGSGDGMWFECRYTDLYIMHYSRDEYAEICVPIPQSFHALAAAVSSLRIAAVLAL